MDKLTDIARINSLLKRLQEARSLLTIKIEGYKQVFSSAIIKLSYKNGYFILDELKPENGDELLRKAINFEVNAQLEGITIRFPASVSEFGEEDGLPYYKAQLPETMDYHQRRAAVRIKLSAANPLIASLALGDATKLEGDIVDLSLGGLRINFQKPLPSTLENGNILKCTFPLPHDKKDLFSAQIIIRVIKHESDKTNRAFIGSQFHNLTKIQERQIQRTIMTLQRVAQKKRDT